MRQKSEVLLIENPFHKSVVEERDKLKAENKRLKEECHDPDDLTDSCPLCDVENENLRLLDAEEGWIEIQKKLSGEVKQLRDELKQAHASEYRAHQREQKFEAEIKRLRDEVDELDKFVETIDRAGEALAVMEGKDYDRYTCWAEPAMELAERIITTEARAERLREALRGTHTNMNKRDAVALLYELCSLVGIVPKSLYDKERE